MVLPAPRLFSRSVVRTLSSCADAARRLVEAVSVLGEHADLSTAAAIADVDEPLVALEEACRAGLLLTPSPDVGVAPDVPGPAGAVPRCTASSVRPGEHVCTWRRRNWPTSTAGRSDSGWRPDLRRAAGRARPELDRSAALVGAVQIFGAPVGAASPRAAAASWLSRARSSRAIRLASSRTFCLYFGPRATIWSRSVSNSRKMRSRSAGSAVYSESRYEVRDDVRWRWRSGPYPRDLAATPPRSPRGPRG